MSRRLAGYAAEIERYLHGGVGVVRKDLDDDDRTASARRQPGEFQAMRIYERGGGTGGGQAGSGSGGTALRSAGGRAGAAGMQAASGRAPTSAPATVSPKVGPAPKSASAPIMIYTATLAGFRPGEEEEERKRRGGGGRGRSGDDGGRRGRIVGGVRAAYQARAVAARAGYAAGAQPAVFKVMPKPPSTSEAAARLVDYLGRRENDKGEKHDIDIFDEDGHVLATSGDRKAFLETFCETFEPPLENTNFIEARFDLSGDVSDDALKEALNSAFGSKPFVYVRDGKTMEVFAHVEERAGPLAKVLAGGRENSRSRALDKIETRLREGFGQAGGATTVEVTAAVGNERQAKYFLQKFIRTHSGASDVNGEPLRGAKNPSKAAASVYEQWRPQLSGRERRNAYHLLFSARAGTDANAVMAAARAVLEERAPGFKFVLAHHKDTKHVHIHAMVQARSADGERLKFYKPDLVAWREAFAEKAREHGIAMVATRRMDHAMTRPFTKEHAGAYNRAQRDPRYQVSAKTVERVEAKRQRRIDRQTLVVNGDTIAAAWQTTATTMRTVGVTGLALTAAQAIGKNLLRYRDGQAEKGASDPLTDRRETSERGQKSFLSHPGMRELNALIGDLDMAQTPLEMRQKMDRVNKALDGMSETLPETERGRFEQYREDVNDKMHDRLARLQFEAEQQRKAGATGAGESTPERETRGRDLPTREDAREPETPRREADAARGRQKQDRNKEKVRQAEEQDRRTQRSNDNDYER